MEKQETTLRIEMIAGITTDIGLSVVNRLEQTDADVVTHSLEAEAAWEYAQAFEVDLAVDRPVDELVTLARNSIPSFVAVVFSIWHCDGEIARLYADPLPGLLDG